MKVCDITQFYAPRSGGVKRYLQEKQRFIHLHRPNDKHLLVVPGEKSRCTAAGNTRTCEIASPIMPRTGGYRALLNLRAVAELIERERPDIIESADPYQLGWFAAKTARMCRIPAIAFYHSHLPGLPVLERIEPIVRHYVLALYNQFAGTIVASLALAEELRGWGVRNVQVIELGIDADVFQPSADKRTNERFTLLYVGRLAPEKNVRLLFDAWRVLPRDRFQLVVIGDGPLRNELPIEARHISYCGDREELAKFYRAADLLVHPGVQETFGLAALEAQACGTPVVGFKGSRMDAVICHEQSSWPNERTPAALADAVLRMSVMPLREIGAAASSTVRERFAWPTVVDRLFCLYAEVCARYQRT